MPRRTVTNDVPETHGDLVEDTATNTTNVGAVASTPAPAKFVPSFVVEDVDDFTVARSGGAGRGRARDTTYDHIVDAMHESGKVVSMEIPDEKLFSNMLIKMRNYSQERYGLTVNVRKGLDNVYQMKLGEKAKRAPRKPKAEVEITTEVTPEG